MRNKSFRLMKREMHVAAGKRSAAGVLVLRCLSNAQGRLSDSLSINWTF